MKAWAEKKMVCGDSGNARRRTIAEFLYFICGIMFGHFIVNFFYVVTADKEGETKIKKDDSLTIKWNYAEVRNAFSLFFLLFIFLQKNETSKQKKKQKCK